MSGSLARSLKTLGNAARTGAPLGGAVAGVLSDAGTALRDLFNLTNSSNRFQGNITFPSDLKVEQNVPYLSMRFIEYTRRGIRDFPSFDTQVKIRLPIPSNLMDSVSVNYEKQDLGTVAGAAVAFATGGPGMLEAGAVQGVRTAIEQVTRGPGDNAAQRIAAEPLRNIGINTERALGAASALSGLAINPFQTILFKSPNFRKHNFSWKFAPINQQETEELYNLIQTFRFHTLPGLSPGAALFSYPSLLELQFRPRDKYLYKFKRCVVEDVKINFAPNGPAFFNSTKGPAAVEFQISLQEVEIWTREDIQKIQEQSL